MNVFWGRTPDPPIFFTNHLRAGVMEKKVEWEKLIFFAA
jgi:hypothetical protein